MRSVAGINRKIVEQTAVVLTAGELKKRIRAGEKVTAEDVDVVTCGTFGVMSGTTAVLAFQAAPAGSFRQVERLTLNRVPAFVGPCPNESNGHVDCIVYGTSRSVDNPSYGGGHLFADLVRGAEVTAEITTDSGRFAVLVSLADMSSAKILVTRGAFRNYMAFMNPRCDPVSTIFSVLPLQGRLSQATVSGCGEINPLENDPTLRFHTPGTPALVNGAGGFILGTGTRSSAEKPNLSLAADMWGMHADLMGGFVTSVGAECLTSVATAIPVVDEEAFAALSVLDEDVVLPIADVTNRTRCCEATYGDVWGGDLRVRVDSSRCHHTCEVCAETVCPVHAIRSDLSIGMACVGCLTCVSACPDGVYSAETGVLHASNGRVLPIVLRQSDRVRGEIAAVRLRDKIRSGDWRFGEI